MAQGMRGRIRRAAWLGFGLLVCSGAVGCLDTDKKPLGGTKQPTTGLPGTPTVSGGTNTGRPGMTTTTGTQPGWNTNTGMQPGGVSRTGGMQPGATNFGSANPGYGGAVGAPTVPNSVVPSVTPQSNYPATGGVPASGAFQPGPTGALPANSGGAYRGQSNDPSVVALSDPGPVPPQAPSGPTPSVMPVSNAPLAPPGPVAPAALPNNPTGSGYYNK